MSTENFGVSSWVFESAAAGIWRLMCKLNMHLSQASRYFHAESGFKRCHKLKMAALTTQTAGPELHCCYRQNAVLVYELRVFVLRSSDYFWMLSWVQPCRNVYFFKNKVIFEISTTEVENERCHLMEPAKKQCENHHKRTKPMEKKSR